MYASTTTTDPDLRVRARVVNSSEAVGEIHLSLGHNASIFLSPAEADKIVCALTAALHELTAVAA